MNSSRFNHERIFNLGLILAGWTLYGFFFASQNYVRQAYDGRSPSFQTNLSTFLTCGYSWALLTLPILYLARRFPFTRENWHRALAVHIPASVIFSFAALTLFVGMRLMIGEAYKPGKLQSLIVEDLHSSVLVYFGILGAKYALSYFLELGAREKEFDLPLSSNGPAPNSLHDEIVEQRAPVPDVFNGTAPHYAERFSVKKAGRIMFISVSEIDSVTSEGNYVKLQTNGTSHLLCETMKAMEQKLDPNDFLRVRRSTIVRIEQIKELHPISNGEFEIVLNNGTKLTSSRRYRKNLDVLLKT